MPAQFMPLQKNAQDLHTVALLKSGRYSSAVAANSATGFGDPSLRRRTGAPITSSRRFFCACSVVLWRLCVGDLRVCRVPSYPVRQPAHSCHPNSFGDEPWQFLLKKELHPCTPSIHPKFAPLPIGQWLSPLYTPTPASLHVLPVTTLIWPKPACSKPQVVPNERRPEFRPARGSVVHPPRR